MGKVLISIASILLRITVIQAVERDMEYSNELINELFKRGSDKIAPYMILTDRTSKCGGDMVKQIEIGIAELDRVTKYNHGHWPAYWIKGKGYQALGNHDQAIIEFRKSYEIKRDNIDVAREFSIELLELGMAEEAVAVNRDSIKGNPNNPGLHANLALALMMNGKYGDALKSVNKALELDRTDTISIELKRYIIDVTNGKRQRPKRMADINGG